MTAPLLTELWCEQEQVKTYVLEQGPVVFRIREVQRALPGISSQTISLVLRELREAGLISVSGRGPGATWTRLADGAKDLVIR